MPTAKPSIAGAVARSLISSAIQTKANREMPPINPTRN